MSVERARELRKTLTPYEARLWIRLRQLRRQGFHIRRQAPFRGYILDFVCFDRRVVIELDGGGHADNRQRAYDAVRDATLRRHGFRVMRFWNHELAEDIGDVMIAICGALSAAPTRAASRPPPSPRGGGRTSALPSPSWGGWIGAQRRDGWGPADFRPYDAANFISLIASKFCTPPPTRLVV
ncbi:MAG TPA: DUF559 domain-containing protein [Phenylobacterium sp.]|nr:DUF559 domain-containing protein [Phenylobacterium sp.]